MGASEYQESEEFEAVAAGVLGRFPFTCSPHSQLVGEAFCRLVPSLNMVLEDFLLPRCNFQGEEYGCVGWNKDKILTYGYHITNVNMSVKQFRANDP